MNNAKRRLIDVRVRGACAKQIVRGDYDTGIVLDPHTPAFVMLRDIHLESVDCGFGFHRPDNVTLLAEGGHQYSEGTGRDLVISNPSLSLFVLIILVQV